MHILGLDRKQRIEKEPQQIYENLIFLQFLSSFKICSYVAQNLGKFQVGVGHNFQMCATGWKWKLNTCWGGDGMSRIQTKTSVGLCPGIDLRFGWKADYVLPEITG